MFTWSLGCAPSPATFAITSFAFMFVEVPEPVWKTSTGNWSSNSPPAIRSPAAAIRSASSGSRRPSSAFTRAAAPLIRASQCTTPAGTGSPETGSSPRPWSSRHPRAVPSPARPSQCPFAVRNLLLESYPNDGPPAAGCSAAEGDQLPRHANRVVVRDQEARARQRPQLSVGQQVERFARPSSGCAASSSAHSSNTGHSMRAYVSSRSC